jgi:hypothetical protein
MTTNHRNEAEERLRAADYQRQKGDLKGARLETAAAQVHATLARADEPTTDAADMRDALTLMRRRERAVREAVSAHLAHALASREPGRWKAAIALTKALDEGDANMDALIDAHLEDDGWDPRSAWKTPASGSTGGDPWAPAGLAPDIPEPVRRVIANQLAQMLLSSDGEAVHAWARNVASALVNEGADLNDAIKTRIYELTLGNTDVPF